MGAEPEALIHPDAAASQRNGWRLALKVAMPFILISIICAGPLYRVWFRWRSSQDYYSHGPLVPFVAAYLVLRKRKALVGEDPPETGALYAAGIATAILFFVCTEFNIDKRWLFLALSVATFAYLAHNLRNLKPEPWRLGLFVLIPALMLCVIAGVHEIVSVGWFAAVIVIIGVILYYLGKRCALIMAFPLIFLFSSVPLPQYKVQEVTMPLKKFATANTVGILRSKPVGIYCERTGSKIEFPGDEHGNPKEVTVGAVCSGLRSLIALISFGLLFAYITPFSALKKTVLFLATIPASFIANLIRILTLALVTYKWDAKVATEARLWEIMESGPLESLVPHLRKISNTPVHDFTGIMIFVVAFVALFTLERLLTYLERRLDRARSDFWVAVPCVLVVWHLTTVAVGVAYPTVLGISVAAALSLLPYVLLFVFWRPVVGFYNELKPDEGNFWVNTLAGLGIWHLASLTVGLVRAPRRDLWIAVVVGLLPYVAAFLLRRPFARFCAGLKRRYTTKLRGAEMEPESEPVDA